MLRNSMSTAKTQVDLIAEQTEARPESAVEEISLPALNMIHTLSEEDLVDIFNTVLKLRPTIRLIEFSLGDDYITKDVPSRVPNSHMAHTLSRGDLAKVFALILYSDPKLVGFRVEVTQDNQGVQRSNMVLRLGTTTPKGPVFDVKGNIIEMGDKEFNPKLRMVSSQSV